MDPKERTKRMIEEEHRKFKEHAEFSKANQGKNPFPLRQTVAVSLPLFALALGLYGFSMYYMRRKLPVFLGDDKSNSENSEPSNDSDATANMGKFGIPELDGELLDDKKQW